MERIYITEKGYKSVEVELQNFLTKDRPSIIKAIAEARAHGDIKENAEYHSAKEKQALIEARISELKSVIARAEIVNISQLSGPIKFGATVKLEDDDTGEISKYQIVSEIEASIENGRLSLKTALARSLIGKDIGDSVEVKAPVGERYFTVLNVEYK